MCDVIIGFEKCRICFSRRFSSQCAPFRCDEFKKAVAAASKPEAIVMCPNGLDYITSNVKWVEACSKCLKKQQQKFVVIVLAIRKVIV